MGLGSRWVPPLLLSVGSSELRCSTCHRYETGWSEEITTIRQAYSLKSRKVGLRNYSKLERNLVWLKNNYNYIIIILTWNSFCKRINSCTSWWDIDQYSSALTCALLLIGCWGNSCTLRQSFPQLSNSKDFLTFLAGASAYISAKQWKKEKTFAEINSPVHISWRENDQNGSTCTCMGTSYSLCSGCPWMNISVPVSSFNTSLISSSRNASGWGYAQKKKAYILYTFGSHTHACGVWNIMGLFLRYLPPFLQAHASFPEQPRHFWREWVSSECGPLWTCEL